MTFATIGRALPPALDAYVQRIAAQGAVPLPNVPLNTEVPSLGPYVLDLGGAFKLTVYPGPRMWFAASPSSGHVDTTA